LIFKQLLDARTAQKVDIYANAANGLACIQQHIGSSELCSDYGGNGPSMAEVLNEMRETGTTRQIVERVFLLPRGEGGFEFDLDKSEKATVIVSTRSAKGAHFMVADKTVRVKPSSSTKQPYLQEIASELEGPGHFKVRAKSDSSEKEFFLLDVRVYRVSE
jgi:hypothetical protein